MFKKKNTVTPAPVPVKEKELKRSDECDNLSKFFKTKIRVETDTRTYITNFYVFPVEEAKENKCCKIL